MQYNLFVTNLCPGWFHCWMGGTTRSQWLVLLDFYLLYPSSWIRLGLISIRAGGSCSQVWCYFPVAIFSQLTTEETWSFHLKLSLPSNKLWIWIPRQGIGKPSDRGDKDDYPFVSKRDLSNPTRQGYPLRRGFFLFFCFYCFFTYDLQWTGKRGGTGIKPVQKLIF